MTRHEGPRRAVPELPSPPELAALRAEAMSQREMAAAVGVDAGQLSRWERGQGEMAYDKIRRYASILRLHATADDPIAYLVGRIGARVALRELHAIDPLERAIEVMATHGHPALPVLNARGDDYAGVLTDAMVCHALGVGEPQDALRAPIASLALDPIIRIGPRDTLAEILAKMGAHALALVEDRDGLPAGFAFRADLYPLLTGARAR